MSGIIRQWGLLKYVKVSEESKKNSAVSNFLDLKVTKLMNNLKQQASFFLLLLIFLIIRQTKNWLHYVKIYLFRITTMARYKNTT